MSLDTPITHRKTEYLVELFKVKRSSYESISIEFCRTLSKKHRLSIFFIDIYYIVAIIIHFKLCNFFLSHYYRCHTIIDTRQERENFVFFDLLFLTIFTTIIYS